MALMQRGVSTKVGGVWEFKYGASGFDVSCKPITSFPRRRVSITPCHMALSIDSRLRGNDKLSLRCFAQRRGIYLKLAETRSRLLSMGMDPVGNTPDEMAAHLSAELVKWARVAKVAKLTPRSVF
jgi:hypothetical protein